MALLTDAPRRACRRARLARPSPRRARSRVLGGAIELVGEPGIGKTRLLAELARLAETRGHLVLSGSASELERDLPFSVFVDALDEYVAGSRATARSPPWTTTSERSSRTSSLRCPPSRAGARRRSSTSATAATAPCARCSSGSRRRSRSCSCSTTSTGPTRRRSSYWARCCGGRRPRACSSPWPFDPARRRSACRPRSSGRTARAR